MKLHRLIDPMLAFERRMTRRPGPPRGVLLIASGGLGDTVLFSLVVERFLVLARDGEPVSLLLRHDAARMSFLFPPSVRIRAIDFTALRRPWPRRRLLAALHRDHFRLVVSTDHLRHPDFDEALALACAAPDSVAMAPRPWPKHQARLDANRRRWRRLVATNPAVSDKILRWSDFAEALTGRHLPPPRVTLPAARRPPVRPLSRPTLIIQPFSAVAAKQSPPDLYRRLIGALPADWRVRIAGHPDDFARNPDYEALLDDPRVSFETASFADLAGLLPSARLVISVDTACMHLAAALGAPTLCLASAAYVGEIVPYAEAVAPPNLRVLWVPMACQGCLGECRRPLVAGMYPCVAALDPAGVERAVADMTGG